MTKESQNIDNLFKGALSNYTAEQPSKSVWRGITGKLFIHDLVNLNWLNIPYFVPAAMIVVAGILTVFLLMPGSDPLIEGVEKQTVVEDVAGAGREEEQVAGAGREEEQLAGAEAGREEEQVAGAEAGREEEQVAGAVTGREEQQVAAEAGREEEQVAGAEAGREEEQVAEAVGSQQPTVNSQQSTINSQQSTINNQQSTINSQQSTISNPEVSVGKPNKIADDQNTRKDIIQERQKAYNPVLLSEKSILVATTEELLKPMAYIGISEMNYKTKAFQNLTLIPNKEITGSKLNIKAFDYHSLNQYSVGIHFTREKVYNSPDDRADNNIYSVDLSFIYNMNKYIFQTGIGYTYFENDHNYRVNYNDLLGTYEDLTSISFTIDSITGRPNPSYSWNTTSVYDTADQSLTTQVTNYYSTLQVPLLLGYNLFEKKRFSVFIKGGPLVSFLICKNEPGATYYSPDKQVTGFDYATPSRTKVNWQFHGSVGVGYQFTQRLSLAVEPTIKYYFNQVYGRNKTADTRPYLFGIRTGIIYSIK